MIYYINKTELIRILADEAKVTKAQANSIINAFMETVSKTLNEGGKVTLVGFGTFSVAERQPRNGRNPQTGDSINIKERKIAKFKAGKGLAANL